jgi:hypothetical protein
MSTDRPLTGDNPKPWFKKKRIIIPLAFLVLGVFGSLTGKSGTSSTGGGGSTTRSYPAAVDGSAVVNPATLAVRFHVTNDGSQAVTPNCTLKAQDVSGTYSGYDIFTPTSPVAPGATQNLVGHLTITKQGASYADQFSLSCVAETSDTTSNSGKAVGVTDISNCGDSYGAFDDSTNTWYWGACMKATGVAPMTHMTCTENGLDSAGKQVATHTFPANTLNDLTIIAYGENETTQPTTTKAIAQSIKSVTVSCHL